MQAVKRPVARKVNGVAVVTVAFERSTGVYQVMVTAASGDYKIGDVFTVAPGEFDAPVDPVRVTYAKPWSGPWNTRSTW